MVKRVSKFPPSPFLVKKKCREGNSRNLEGTSVVFSLIETCLEGRREQAIERFIFVLFSFLIETRGVPRLRTTFLAAIKWFGFRAGPPSLPPPPLFHSQNKKEHRSLLRIQILGLLVQRGPLYDHIRERDFSLFWKKKKKRRKGKEDTSTESSKEKDQRNTRKVGLFKA